MGLESHIKGVRYSSGWPFVTFMNCYAQNCVLPVCMKIYDIFTPYEAFDYSL